jgi:hypothetical protein
MVEMRGRPGKVGVARRGGAGPGVVRLGGARCGPAGWGSGAAGRVGRRGAVVGVDHAVPGIVAVKRIHAGSGGRPGQSRVRGCTVVKAALSMPAFVCTW